MKLLTTKEAAEIFNVHRQTIANWVDAGFLPCEVKGKRRLISSDAIEALKDRLNDYKDCSDKIDKCLEQNKAYLDIILSKRRTLLSTMRIAQAAAVGIDKDFVKLVLDEAVNYGVITPREKTFLLLFMGGETLQDIGERYEISGARVAQIINKAKRKAVAGSNGNAWELLRLAEQENENLKRKITVLCSHTSCQQTQEDQEQEAEQTPEFNQERLQLLATPVNDLDLSVRALNCLKSAEVETLGDLVKHEWRELLRYRNFGKKSLREIEELLEKYNLHLGMDVHQYLTEPHDTNL